MAFQQLSGFELKKLEEELQILVDSKVDKIYMLSKKDLIFNFHKTGIGKLSLRIVLPNLLYFTKRKYYAPETPLGYCMFLRKYIGSARLRSISMVSSERILDFFFENKDEKYHLFFEFFDKGNAILTDEDLLIKSPLENQRWAERIIRGGVKYEFPKKDYDLFNLDIDKFSVLMNGNDTEVTKKLTLLGLGKDYSLEIMKRAKIDIKKISLSSSELESLLNSIKKFLRETATPFYYKNRTYVSKISTIKKYIGFRDILSGDISDGQEVITVDDRNCFLEETKVPDDSAVLFDRISDVFDFFIEMPKNSLDESDTEVIIKKDKLSKVIDAQSKRKDELEHSAIENQAKGEAIYENYSLIKDILDQIILARKKLSWKEIKEKLNGHKIIKNIDEKNGIITIDIPEKKDV